MFSALGNFWDRNKKSKRQSAKRNTKLKVENLENRELLTVNMTDYEQLILELVNRARMDPLAEVARNPAVADLNQDLDPGTLTADPKQPLASVQALVDAGRTHGQDMLDRDYFSHYTLGSGANPTDRAAAAGYSGPVGENIAWNGLDAPIDELTETLIAHDALFESHSHRENLLFGSYEVAGIGVRFGQFTHGAVFNAVMVAEEFGFSSGDSFLTGVVYSDDVIDDDFYSVGESESGITITADDGAGNVFSTTSGSSGSYNIKLPAGTYTVTATGASIPASMVTSNVTIGSQNVKVDFDTTQAPVSTGVNEDLVGLNAGEEFWAGISNGTTLDTAYWGEFPSTPDNFSGMQVGDFNGDGFDDIAGQAANGDLWVGISTDTGSGGRTFVSSKWGNLTDITDWEILVGDFNGDGLDDLMGRAEINGSFWLAESTGSGFVNSHWGGLLNSITWVDLVVGDFNGDGMDDTAARAPDGTWWGSISNGSTLQNSYWGKWSNTVVWSDVSVGDFNGDGMDDIAGRQSNKNWWVNSSVGTYFVVQWWSNWTDTVTWLDVSVGDFNGDGRDDIAGRAESNGQWWLGISNGTNFINEYWGYWPTSVTWYDANVIDSNGDGRDDLIGRAANGQWWAFESNGQLFTSRLATTWSPGVTWQYVGIGNFA